MPCGFVTCGPNEALVVSGKTNFCRMNKIVVLYTDDKRLYTWILNCHTKTVNNEQRFMFIPVYH